ncbi:MAG TPA: hypothetical protein VFW87_21020 [Pirellulales bacterium]|nr:hypothetical protein [Pirellulales bacterium]
MADRWVVVVRLTVLLSGMLPVAAASAQSPPTRSNPLREGVLTSATAPASRSSKSKKSPLQRFMSKGDDGAASAGKPLSAQSSLQPLGPGWLKDGVPE